MWKKIGLSALFLAAFFAPAGGTAGESVVAQVNEKEEIITLKTQGKSYILNVAKGIPRLQVDTLSYPVTFRFAEWGAAPDWFKVVRLVEADVTRDEAEAKTVKAVFELAFVRRKPPPGSTRAWEPKTKISARVEMVLTVQRDLPCLFMNCRVVNTGDPFASYTMLLLGGGDYFAIPGPAGIEKKKFRRKYADVKEGAAWVYLSRSTGGLGAVLRNKLLLREGGSPTSRRCQLFLNTVHKGIKLRKGKASEMQLAFVPASSPEEVAALHEKIKRSQGNVSTGGR